MYRLSSETEQKAFPVVERSCYERDGVTIAIDRFDVGTPYQQRGPVPGAFSACENTYIYPFSPDEVTVTDI